MRRLLLVLTVIATVATPAFAQDDKPYDIHIGGGWMFPVSSVKDSFNTGGTFTIGGTYFMTPTFGIMAEYNYDKMSGPEKTIFVTPGPVGGVGSTQLIQSNQQIHSGVFDVVARSKPNDKAVGGYFITGIGIYHRIVQLTSPAVGYTTVCDPYWYVCYPAAVSVDNILGDRGSSDFGFNVGGGITFGHEAKFYVEMRYTYVWGPTITPPAGATTTQSLSSNASYLPLIFGIRF